MRLLSIEAGRLARDNAGNYEHDECSIKIQAQIEEGDSPQEVSASLAATVNHLLATQRTAAKDERRPKPQTPRPAESPSAQAKPVPPAAEKPKEIFCNEQQAVEIEKLIEETGTDEAALLLFYKVTAIRLMSQEQAENAKAALFKKKAQAKKGKSK